MTKSGVPFNKFQSELIDISEAQLTLSVCLSLINAFFIGSRISLKLRFLQIFSLYNIHISLISPRGNSGGGGGTGGGGEVSRRPVLRG
jgi:hypothetical protein